MKHFILLLVLFFPLCVAAQFQDDFSNNSFPHLPRWHGNTDAFRLTNESLLKSKTINTTFISAVNTLAHDVIWEFGIQLDFNPSTQNQLRIYLIADRDSLTKPLNGYFIQIGESGDTDRYQLYKQLGEAISLVMSSPPKPRPDPLQVKSRIKVTRDNAGNWKLYTAQNEETFALDAYGTDNDIDSSAFFGLQCIFTNSYSDKFGFDYVNIDTLSMIEVRPNILSTKVIDSVSLQLTFSEKLDSTSVATINHYTLDPGYGSPQSVVASDSIAVLSFADSLLTNDYTLNVKGIEGSTGNVMQDTAIIFHYEAPETPIFSQKLKPDHTDEVLFIDTFENAFSTQWNGQTEKFSIKNHLVEHKDNIISPAFIYIPNTEIKNRLWEAGIEVNGNLTSQNHVRIYLSADNDSLSGAQKGYYLQIDGSGGNHHYKLYKQSSNSRKLLFQSQPIKDIDKKIRTRVRISCDLSGIWKLYADEYDHGQFQPLLNMARDSSLKDIEHSVSSYTGWMTRFTKTRINDYKLHYFLIRELTEIPQDTIPPSILTVSVLDSMSIQVTFSETVDQLTAANIDHYSLDPDHLSPESISTNDSTAILSFTQPLATNNYNLHIHLVSDPNGNVMADTSINFGYRKPYKAKPFDIIINEIMAAPNPPQGLPAIEYIELRNLTDRIIDLQNWTYSSKTKKYQFGSDSIKAHSYLLLYKESDSLLISSFGDSIGLSSWPTLVDNGTTLTLKNEYGIVIDAVSYESSWYGDSQKNKGGWSLERIDPYAHCNGKHNWKASNNAAGGTPGGINSINQENTPTNLQIAEIEISEPNQLKVIFNKVIDPYSATTPNTYQINNGMGTPDSTSLVDLHTIILFYSQDFMRGNHYQVQAIDIADCTGLRKTLTKELYYPDTIAIGDIIINEILPNPKTGGVEFVEIYNNSKKTVDIADLSLATIRASDGKVNQKKISIVPHLMLPATYRLLSLDPDVIQSQYFSPNPDAFIKMNAFPILTNGGGTIVLLDENTQIDRLNYQENMHDPMIIDPKGVSLERVKFNVETNAPENFKSAAATVGYATPGYQNSQFQEDGETSQKQIHLSSRTFSPDNDGFEDLLEINYRFPEEGKMVNIEIYNNEGRLVKHLKRNHRLATSGVVYWDGLMDDGGLANVGIYIVLIEIYDHKGLRTLFKKSCVLASKF